MDYVQAILDDAEKVRETVSEVSCCFECSTHDDAWLALFLLQALAERGDRDLIGSAELQEVLRLGKLIHDDTMEQVRKDAALAEDAAIEQANEMRYEQRLVAKESRAAA